MTQFPFTYCDLATPTARILLSLIHSVRRAIPFQSAASGLCIVHRLLGRSSPSVLRESTVLQLASVAECHAQLFYTLLHFCRALDLLY